MELVIIEVFILIVGFCIITLIDYKLKKTSIALRIAISFILGVILCLVMWLVSQI